MPSSDGLGICRIWYSFTRLFTTIRILRGTPYFLLLGTRALEFIRIRSTNENPIRYCTIRGSTKRSNLKDYARENLARPLVFGMFGGELPATTIIYTKDGTGISRRKEYSGCQGIDIDPSFKVDLDNVRYSWLVACG